ncbi:monocarboxylate transporter 13 [Neoarius graeffei]|uniref:monocarboxylate transporter 13 n=1 Tax=Neoarius graeffei TaxID=443677 RepID=UPI00298CC21B|nr:monocarboxylate transporter 13 [Neoarius graeffei]
MEECGVEPPDGGYGWVVVISAFFSRGFTIAVLKNFGLFFLEIQIYYNVLTSAVSWITSTSIAMFHFGAPFAGSLGVYVTQRGVMMIGGTLAASGMIFASLGLGFPWMYLSVGVLQGLGISFCWMPANIMVSHYFKRWRPIAFSISSSGECIFAMAFSPFFQWLIEAYSWQGALLIIGGLQLNLFVCGALMRPLKPKVFSQTLTPLVDPTSKKVPFQCSMIQRPELLLYIVFAILATAGFFIPPLFLVPYANHKGIEQYWAAFLLSSLSLADLLGRLACGWLANLQVFRNLRILATVSILLGTVVLLLPLAQDYWSIMVFSTMYGFLSGCVVAVHITSIVDIVGLASFDSALGLFMLLRTSGVLVIPPAAGWLVDWTSEFNASFYLAGLCCILSAVFVMMVDRLVEKKNRDLVKIANASADSEICPINGRDPLEA